MESCSLRGLTILQKSLQTLNASLPNCSDPVILPEKVEYTYRVYRSVVERMAKHNYKMPEQAEIKEDYDEWKWKQKLLPVVDMSKEIIKNGIENALVAANEEIVRRNTTKTTEESDWSDVSNSSLASSGSFSTNRGHSLARAKAKMKQSMRESSAKRTTRMATGNTGLTPKNKKLKITAHVAPEASSAERQSRSRVPRNGPSEGKQMTSKRQPSVHEKKVTRGPSTDRAEFARLQNQKVQLFKEKRSQLERDTEKKETVKPTLKAAPKPAPTTTKPKVTSKAKIEAKVDDFLQPEIPGKFLVPDAQPINSTFMAGVSEVPPMFNATLTLNGPTIPLGAAALPSDETYVARPKDVTYAMGIKPKSVGQFAEDTLLNPNESYRNYGIDDLCSDSDNTDDESKPKKPIPGWASMRSDRFKRRVEKQVKLGTDIEKYGAYQIVVPEFVDLEAIFEEQVNMRRNLDTSSFMWDTTQTFIQG